MFFFFFDELYYRPVVHRAFKMVMLDKMLKDGYFDMSIYVGGSIRKQDVIDRLKSEGSKYCRLYDGSYPKPDTAAQEWDKRLSTSNNAGTEEDVELTQTEAEAIVNWVYRVFSKKEERQEFTENVFKQIKDLYNIQNDIKFTQNIVKQEKNASAAMRKLAQVVKRDLPVSTVQIYGPELLRNCIVNVIKNNSSAKQDGAFII